MFTEPSPQLPRETRLARVGARNGAARALVALAALLAASCGETRQGVPAHEHGDASATAAEPQPLDAGASEDTTSSVDAEAAVAADAATDAQAEAGAAATHPAVPAERRALCARPADDAVRDIFCTSDKPTVTSLRELGARLRLNVLRPETDEATAAAIPIDPAEVVTTSVFLGLSTALSGNLVSPINPRAIHFNEDSFIAFQRGVQKVEIVTRDRSKPRFNFYLLSFAQACNERAGGCRPGDLYTLSVERDWSSLVLEDDEDLKNTPNDCRMCHQRGARAATLLMRELRAPWTHFFGPEGDAADGGYSLTFSGAQLAADYTAAKGSESYGGVPAAFMKHTVGGALQLAVDPAQPLEFDAPVITIEIEESVAQGTPRRSAAWDQAYAAFKRGEHLALPHFELRPTDPVKQRALTDAYARYRRGEIGADALPDLGDIFPDDPRLRAEIGLATEPGATPAETLIQACGPCHNDVLDQSISRARFNIALGRMSRAELDLAIARIQLPTSDVAAMPPKGMRQLEPDAKKRLLSYLAQAQRAAADDAQLESAAKVGMAKPRAEFPRF